MITTSLQGRDVYLLSTDGTGAKTYSQHRVWCPDTFIAARKLEAGRHNAAVAPDKRKASAELITRAQFDAR